MSLQFVRNMGQLGEGGGAFYCHDGPVTLAFHDDHITVTIKENSRTDMSSGTAYEVWFIGANRVPPQGMDPTGTTFGFFLGDVPTRWVSGVEGFGSVVYRNLWNGVDLCYRAQDGSLKYEFFVRAGGDPSSIRLAFAHVDGITLDKTGDLVVRTSLGDVRDERPTSYQDGPGGRTVVSSSFRTGRCAEVGFDVGPYDTSRPLVIDPRLLFSTFLGSASEDWAHDFVVGRDGDIYVMGATEGLSFPTTAGAFDPTHSGGTDILLCRLSQNGQRMLNATYIGGGGNDNGHYTTPSQVQNFGGIQLDGSGALYLTGHTNSTNFPTTTSAFDRSQNGGYDVFVLKMSSTLGVLAFSTYVGGPADDFATDIALDAEMNSYIVGTTTGAFPSSAGAFDTTPNGGEDAFALKLDATGSSLLLSTLIGGTSKDWGNAVGVDGAGCAYIAGTTDSEDFPVKTAYDPLHNGLRDIFVTKLLANWSAPKYSTYIGTSDQDYGYDLVVDDLGRAYVVGYTTSAAFPTVSGCLDAQGNGGIDAVALRLDASGSSLGRSTYLGGAGDERGLGIGITPSGDVLIAGSTTGTVPVTADAYATANAGDNDVFVMRLDGTLSTLRYGSLFGGSGDDRPCAIGPGILSDVLVVGHTVSRNFPAPTGAFQANISGGTDGFVLKIGEPRPPAWGALPIILAVEDVPLVHDFSSEVSDPDTPIALLSISARSAFVVEVSGLKVTFLFPNGVLDHEISMEICDEYVKVSARVNFTITPVNDPPTCTIPTTFYAIEDEPLHINFTPHVHDIDNSLAELSLSTDSPDATVSGLVVTVLYHEGVLSSELWVNVSDGSAMSEVHIRITVGPLDDPPVFSQLPTFEAAEDSVSVFNLTPYVSDADTPIERLKVTVSDANLTVEGLELRYLPRQGGSRFIVYVMVSDGATQVTATLWVQVTEVNDPPLVLDVPPQTIIEDDPGAIDLSRYIIDEDTPKDALVLECADPCLESIQGLGLTLLLTTWEAERLITFTVFDGIARTVGSVLILIHAVDDAPIILALGGQSPPFSISIDEGSEAYYAIEVYDEDSPRLEFSIESPWPGISVLQNGTVHILAAKGDVGEYSARLKIDDLGGRNATASIRVDVLNVNDPPTKILVLEPFNHSTVVEGENVTFAIEVWDPDTLLGQQFTVTWVSNVSGVLRTLTSQDELRFMTNILPLGIHRITVNVTDGQYSTETWFETTVMSRLVPPTVDEPDTGMTFWPIAIAAVVITLVAALLIVILVVIPASRRRAKGGVGDGRGDESAVSQEWSEGVKVPRGPLTMEGDLATLSRHLGEMADQLEAQRAAETVATSQTSMAVPEFEAVTVAVELTAKEEADRERTREVREVMKALTQLPQGLPTTLSGWDIAELAVAIVDGVSRQAPDGTPLVLIKNRWYYADRTNVGTFAREWKEEVSTVNRILTETDRERKVEQLEAALLEGKISEQTYKELTAKYSTQKK